MKCAVLVLACVAAFGGVADTPARADSAGLRDALAERGIAAGFNYTGEVFDVVRGGISRGASLNGLLEAYTTLDLEKISGWQGATLHARGFYIHGEGPSTQHAGNLLAVSNAEALSTVRLFELWIEQAAFEDKLKIRFGQLAADSDFFISDTASVFLNGTFGWPAITSSNMIQGGPAYPLATPGVRLEFLQSKSLTLLAGLYNGSPADPKAESAERDNLHGLNFRVDDPPLLMLEAQYKYDAGLPGILKVGGWNHFGDFADQRTGGNVDGNYGGYAVIDQQVWNGTSVFGRVSGSPHRQNVIDFYFDTGIVFSGVVPGRPKDSFGTAFGYGNISGRARHADIDAQLAVIRDYEAVLEINYHAEIVPGWTLVPDFQYIWHPGGHIENPSRPGTAIGDAAVFGLRSTISY
jgi:porin